MMLQRILAYIRRWRHGLAQFPMLMIGRLDQGHRDFTCYKEADGIFKTTTVIACDCGKVFWAHSAIRDGQRGAGFTDAELVRGIMETAGFEPPKKYR